jgi:HAD superfamily hydrolase (TIGR01509 family)
MTLSFSKNWPRGLLFDHDGVLVASEPLQAIAWSKLLAELGLPFRAEDFQARVGKTAPEILRELFAIYRPDAPLSPDQIEPLCTRKNDHYLASVSEGLRAYPGVREGLAFLEERRIPMAVVSNARKRELRAGLEALGLADFFQTILSRDETRIPKPDPTPYLMGAAELGLAPEECLAVEDSPSGIEAALRAGVPAAALLTSFPSEVMATPVPGRPDLRPWRIFRSIEDLFCELRLSLS